MLDSVRPPSPLTSKMRCRLSPSRVTVPSKRVPSIAICDVTTKPSWASVTSASSTPPPNTMVSAPSPAVQPSTAASVLAAAIASRSEQSPSVFCSSLLVLTVIVAACAVIDQLAKRSRVRSSVAR